VGWPGQSTNRRTSGARAFGGAGAIRRTARVSTMNVNAARGWLPTVRGLRERFYPEAVQRDPVVAFIRRLEGVVKPTDDVLDLGAGAGELNTHALKGRVHRLVGVDVDPRVGTNPLLDVGIRADIGMLPFRDCSFDIVFSIYVLEHVVRPDRLVAEIGRVLRPGGKCLMLTPNILHYVTLLSRLTPTRLHKWINGKRGRPAEDTFPTMYRLNSRRALADHFNGAGLARVSIDLIEVQPNYLTFSPLSYVLGVWYERLVNATEMLSSFRVNLIAVFRKPETEPAQTLPAETCRT
jgi:SAM-dependent methyltransferase